ncbi:MAG: hypothetical protein QOD99_2209 [Chthoniobacter sp.]|jgi:predicted phosphodiesterase|nr:hypothetical protein [Chthoniobacter sp.]
MSLAEPIRILSDIHFGHPASIVPDPEALAPLFNGAGTVVFNGDTVELRFMRGRARGKRNAEQVRKLCTERGAEPVFINGNHDPIISHTNHLDLADGAILVTHGDMLFHDISPWGIEAPIVGEAHTKALSELHENAFDDFEQRLSASKRASLSIELHKPRIPRGALAGIATIARECWPPWRPLQIVKCWIETPARAVALARVFRPRARIVIIGHTHFSGVWRQGPRVIINSGSFLSVIGGRTMVDIEGSRVTLRKITRRGDTFEPGPEIETFSATKLKPHEGF